MCFSCQTASTRLAPADAAGAGAGVAHATAPVHQRGDLRRGDVVTGPAVIEEYGSTLPLHPGFTAEVDAHGNLLVKGAGA